VIAGAFRSRQLLAPRGMMTRPTSDRLRETLFNILAPRMEGCYFVDLYAGTGAVGIEALSRGAAHVWFAENAAPAISVIRRNLAALEIDHSATLETRGVGAMLHRLDKLSHRINLVYVDPPYEAEAEYTNTLNFLGSAQGCRGLSPGALVIAEHSSKTKLAANYGALELRRVVKQGDAALSFFGFAEEMPHPDGDR
jgi:16S rRNA (guanine966-N2)-methyltransferase